MSHVPMFINHPKAQELQNEWGLELKLAHILADNQVTTIWEILALTKRDLLLMPGIRHAYIHQIETKLNEFGLQLRRET